MHGVVMRRLGLAVKTCDICERTDRDESIEFGGVNSLYIGTTIDTVRVNAQGVQHECPVTCDLCCDCIEKVNASIADHMKSEFGLTIRR